MQVENAVANQTIQNLYFHIMYIKFVSNTQLLNSFL